RRGLPPPRLDRLRGGAPGAPAAAFAAKRARGERAPCRDDCIRRTSPLWKAQQRAMEIEPQEAGTEVAEGKRDEIERLKREIVDHLVRDQAHWPETATRGDWWRAVSLTVRGRAMERACVVRRCHYEHNVKR